MSSSEPESFSKVRVYTLLGFGITAIGFSPILVKLASGESPYLVATVRTLMAFLILVPVFFARKKEEIIRQIPTKENVMVAVSGILLGLHLISWIASIYFTSIASASVLVTIHPIALILFERFVYKYNFRSTVWMGVLIAFSGSLVLGYSDYDSDSIHANPLLGNSLATFAAFIFAAYFLIGNRVRQKRNWIEYVFPVYGWAAFTCLIALLLIDGVPHEISGLVLLLGFGLAIGPQVAGHGALNYAVKYVSPTLIATLILFEPAVSSTIAYFLFDEVPHLLSFVGMMIILSGVVLTWSKKKSD